MSSTQIFIAGLALFACLVAGCAKADSELFTKDELKGLEHPAKTMPAQAGEWMKYGGPPPGKPGSKWKSVEEYEASKKKGDSPGKPDEADKANS